MEPYTHYLMWMKSRHDIVMSSLINKKNNNSSSSSSWKEEAFADDKSGGVLGGFVWPLRSYFCSFCKREFRSAQALGGHMNVHRRDRAKLKQSLIISPPTNTQDLHPQDLNHTSSIHNSYSFHFSQPNLPSPCGSKNEETMLPNQELDCSVDTKLAFGMDLDEDMIRCKRRKKTGFSLLKKPCYGLQSERLGLGNKVNNPIIMEDIDLELRLGDPPAVK